jgi:hypothetical protein
VSTRDPESLNVKAAALSLGLFFAFACSACNELVPEKVVLTPAGSEVELVTEPPNSDVYVEIGGATARAMGVEKGEAFNQARNALRNEAAKKGGSIVKIDDVSASLAWDVGQTVVRITGSVYKPR